MFDCMYCLNCRLYCCYSLQFAARKVAKEEEAAEDKNITTSEVAVHDFGQHYPCQGKYTNRSMHLEHNLCLDKS